MDSSILRQIWSVIEENHTNFLLGLGDAELVKQLLSQLDRKTILSSEEAITVSAYLYSRTSLIRDFALSRMT
ncbi:MAG: hypothetical protein ACHBN1_35805 [Heteroscytonema crispum UTEX LB 1556]